MSFIGLQEGEALLIFSVGMVTMIVQRVSAASKLTDRLDSLKLKKKKKKKNMSRHLKCFRNAPGVRTSHYSNAHE